MIEKRYCSSDSMTLRENVHRDFFSRLGVFGPKLVWPIIFLTVALDYIYYGLFRRQRSSRRKMGGS